MLLSDDVPQLEDLKIRGRNNLKAHLFIHQTMDASFQLRLISFPVGLSIWSHCVVLPHQLIWALSLVAGFPRARETHSMESHVAV